MNYIRATKNISVKNTHKIPSVHIYVDINGNICDTFQSLNCIWFIKDEGLRAYILLLLSWLINIVQ